MPAAFTIRETLLTARRVVICAVLSARAAAAPLGFRAEVGVVGGYDTNAFLVPELGEALGCPPGPDAVCPTAVPDLFVEAAPRLLGEWAPGRNLVSIDYGLSVRQFADPSNARIISHGGRASWTFRPGAFGLRLAAEFDSFQPEAFPDEGYAALAFAPGVSWDFGGGTSVSLEAAAARREFNLGGGENGARARLGIDGGRGRALWGIGYRFDGAVLDAGGGDRALHRAEVYGRVQAARTIVFTGSLSGGARFCSGCATTATASMRRADAVLTGRGAVEWNIVEGLQLALGVDYLASNSEDPGGRWSRLSPWLSLTLAFDQPARAAPDAPENEFRPHRVEGGVRFVVKAPGAREVAVAGTFNGWDASLGALSPSGEGLFAGVLPVAPGEHLYMFVVDGQWVTPPDAEAYRDDGFGRRNGVLFVIAGPEGR